MKRNYTQISSDSEDSKSIILEDKIESQSLMNQRIKHNSSASPYNNK